MPKDFGNFMWEILPQEVQGFWTAQISRYIGMSGLQLTYSKQELEGILKWFVHEWVLELENTNFVYIKERGGNSGVSRELQTITKRAWESGLFWVEKAFGYDERSEERPKSKGEAMGRQLLEIFKRNDDEFFARMGEDLRASEFAKTKAISKRFNSDIERWIRIQISRNGF